MSKKILDLIAARLKTYPKTTDQQAINAAKEIIQELALLGLSRAGFFKKAAFHGGSALRIFYGLGRFSEDLNFCLEHPDSNYSLLKAIELLHEELTSWGLRVEIKDRSKGSCAAQKAFLKESSMSALLTLEHPVHRDQKFMGKLEIYTNPPRGAKANSVLCDFPTDFYVTTHYLPSMFAGKLHSILCRTYPKGRDCYDLMEYFSRKAQVNYPYLLNALLQQGPFAEALRNSELTLAWLISRLKDKIAQAPVAKLRADVLPFVEDEKRLELWSRQFFEDKLARWAEHAQKLQKT